MRSKAGPASAEKHPMTEAYPLRLWDALYKSCTFYKKRELTHSDASGIRT
jgi:hypothetical protein